jgi:hypothetical protein
MDQAAMQTVTVEDQTSAVVVSAHHLGECGLAWNPSPLVAGEAPPPPYISVLEGYVCIGTFSRDCTYSMSDHTSNSHQRRGGVRPPSVGNVASPGIPVLLLQVRPPPPPLNLSAEY